MGSAKISPNEWDGLMQVHCMTIKHLEVNEVLDTFQKEAHVAFKAIASASDKHSADYNA